jgi:RNA polymerase sigma-70 factor (ECF subfamily)
MLTLSSRRGAGRPDFRSREIPGSANRSPPRRNRDAMDDDELIAAVADGDDVALRALFARHAPWLAARLRAVLPAAEVEDVLQETFLAVWRGAAGYRPAGAGYRPGGAGGSGGGWLWGIARRQAALWLRRRGPAAVPLPAALDGPGPPDPAEAALARAELATAVAALGPAGSPDRETWRLMYLEDRPVAEVAELMGVPVGTVKSRAHRARRQLRAALRRQPAGEGGGR